MPQRFLLYLLASMLAPLPAVGRSDGQAPPPVVSAPPASSAPPAATAGEVSFQSSGSAAAQGPFLRGLALLHDFEYEDAAAQFRRAQEIDPGFAMAYWGEAMTYNHPIWMQQDRDAALAALERLGATPEARRARAGSPRERDYLAAVEVLYGAGSKEERDFRYAGAMAAVHQRYPDDVDATAFYALALLGTAHHGRDFAVYMRSAALLEEVFPSHPHHPGVLHYLIHSYDDPIHAPLGVRAARLYGAVAPDAAHALHMTSHIFVALGAWDEVIAANQSAIRVVNQQRAKRGLPPRSCGHYVSWLHYGYLQERRFDEASQTLAACGQEAAVPAAGVAGAPRDADATATGAYAEMRLLATIESGQSAADPFLARPEAPVGARFTAAYGEALAAAGGGDRKAFHAAAARLRDAQADLLAAIAADPRPAPGERQRAEVVGRQVEALERLRDGRADEGIAMLRQAAAGEAAMALEFGPPQVEKPTGELLGDELLALGRMSEAAEAYRSALARAPGRTRSLAGLLRAEQALGDPAAEQTRAQLDRYVRTVAP
jgi:tetratricopeptide (TPR) repeat protein